MIDQMTNLSQKKIIFSSRLGFYPLIYVYSLLLNLRLLLSNYMTKSRPRSSRPITYI